MPDTEKLLVYRVWFTFKDESTGQAFFTEKEMAKDYIEHLKKDPLLADAHMNSNSWFIDVEL